MRGKPRELKLLEGTLRTTRDNPPPEGLKRVINEGLPKPPKELDSEAKKHWYRLAEIFKRVDWLSEADTEALATLAQLRSRLGQHWARQKRVTMEIKKCLKQGMADEADRLEDKQLRLITGEMKLIMMFRKMCNEFGMTPVSRQKVYTVSSMKDGSSSYDDWKRKKKKLSKR